MAGAEVTLDVAAGASAAAVEDGCAASAGAVVALPADGDDDVAALGGSDVASLPPPTMAAPDVELAVALSLGAAPACVVDVPVAPAPLEVGAAGSDGAGAADGLTDCVAAAAAAGSAASPGARVGVAVPVADTADSVLGALPSPAGCAAGADTAGAG